MADSAPTPMMAQYLALKREAGDCLLFYRMGDFFELFFDDARVAAGVLDIALTSRGEHGGAPIPMCGVPVHSAEGYLARLIKAGCRVAIAEQTESPEEAKKRGGSKALVARDIVRFVTAGTLTEEALLEPRRANVLAAVCEVRGTCGVAACDISTGRMELEECELSQLAAALARLGSSEVVCPEEWDAAPPGAIARPRQDFASDEGEARLKAIHGVATLDGFGSFSRPMLAAAGGLVAYLDHAGRGALPLLLPPVARASGSTLAMDEATRGSLEILESQQGGRAGSLLAAVDRCVTGAGARQLAEDLAAPLTGRPAIERRLALVQWFHADSLLRADLRGVLRSLPDIGRALGRVVAGRGSPRDLGQLRDGLGEARRIRDALQAKSERPELLEELLPSLAGHGALTDLLSRALVPAPPTERQNGGYHRRRLRPCARRIARRVGQCPPGDRRARGEIPRRNRHRRAQDPPQRRARLFHRGAEPACRRPDGLGQRLHPPPDDGQRGPLQFALLHEEASRIAEAGGHALAAEERHFEDLVAEVVGAGSRYRRDRRSAGPDRRRRRSGRAGGRRRLGPARDRAGAAASRSSADAIRWSKRRWRKPGSASSPTTARYRPRTGCG